MAKKSNQRTMPRVEKDMHEYTESSAPARDPKKIILGVWLLIVLGLLAGFLYTTNQNIGEAPPPPPGQTGAATKPDPADLQAKMKPYQDRLNDNPKDVMALVGIGFVYLEGAEHQKALVNFEKALEEEENHIEGTVGLAMTYQMIGRQNDALDLFNKALELDPNNDFAAVRKAHFLSDVENKHDEALELLNKVKQRQPAGEVKDTLEKVIADIKKKAK